MRGIKHWNQVKPITPNALSSTKMIVRSEQIPIPPDLLIFTFLSIFLFLSFYEILCFLSLTYNCIINLFGKNCKIIFGRNTYEKVLGEKILPILGEFFRLSKSVRLANTFSLNFYIFRDNTSLFNKCSKYSADPLTSKFLVSKCRKNLINKLVF